MLLFCLYYFVVAKRVLPAPYQQGRQPLTPPKKNKKHRQTFAFEAINGLAPMYLSELLRPTNPADPSGQLTRCS